MKVNFMYKPMPEDLQGKDEFKIEKTIEISKKEFREFLETPLADYDFIEQNIKSMYTDKKGIMHCIFITTETSDFGVLVESEGHSYARYACVYPKFMIK